MITVSKETLAVLRRLGLNQYESKTYLALLGVDSSSATQLSDMAGIPRPRVYDVLAKLEKKGFVVVNPGRPTKYSGIAVQTAIEALKKQKEEEHEKELEEIEGLEAQLMKAVEVSKPASVEEETVWVLKNRKNIYAVLQDLIRNAGSHITITTDKQGVKRKKKEIGDALREAEKRGVSVEIKEGHPRIVTVDNHTLVFLNDGSKPKDDKVAWIKSPYLTDYLKDRL
jgi:sugar-specific transcriptional regulator TrmB